MSFWTDQRIAELKIRWDTNGESAAQICLAMNAPSRGAVISKVRRLGLAIRATKHANGARRPSGLKRRRAIDTKSHKPWHRQLFTAVNTLPGCANPKPLLALRNCDCRWPVAGCGAALLCCAAPTVEGRPYCPDHCRRAYLAPDRDRKISFTQRRGQ